MEKPKKNLSIQNEEERKILRLLNENFGRKDHYNKALEIKFLELLGKGSQGEVRKVQLKTTDRSEQVIKK